MVNSRIEEVKAEIANKLKGSPGFDSVDISADYKRDYAIKGRHKDVKGYFYGATVIFSSDFSDVDEAVDDFVEHWRSVDNEEDVRKYNDMLREFSRWGTE